MRSKEKGRDGNATPKQNERPDFNMPDPLSGWFNLAKHVRPAKVKRHFPKAREVRHGRN
jgi:hypothetical protein